MQLESVGGSSFLNALARRRDPLGIKPLIPKWTRFSESRAQASLAQLVEQPTLNRWVVGSIPTWGTVIPSVELR